MNKFINLVLCCALIFDFNFMPSLAAMSNQVTSDDINYLKTKYQSVFPAVKNLNSTKGNSVVNQINPNADGQSLLELASGLNDYNYNSGGDIRTANGDLRGVQILIALGANPNILDNNGSTPLMEAALTGQDKIVDYLLSNGAKPGIINKHNRIAYDYAYLSQQDPRYQGADLQARLQNVIDLLTGKTKPAGQTSSTTPSTSGAKTSSTGSGNGNGNDSGSGNSQSTTPAKSGQGGQSGNGQQPKNQNSGGQSSNGNSNGGTNNQGQGSDQSGGGGSNSLSAGAIGGIVTAGLAALILSGLGAFKINKVLKERAATKNRQLEEFAKNLFPKIQSIEVEALTTMPNKTYEEKATILKAVLGLYAKEGTPLSVLYNDIKDKTFKELLSPLFSADDLTKIDTLIKQNGSNKGLDAIFIKSGKEMDNAIRSAGIGFRNPEERAIFLVDNLVNTDFIASKKTPESQKDIMDLIYNISKKSGLDFESTYELFKESDVISQSPAKDELTHKYDQLFAAKLSLEKSTPISEEMSLEELESIQGRNPGKSIAQTSGQSGNLTRLQDRINNIKNTNQSLQDKIINLQDLSKDQSFSEYSSLLNGEIKTLHSQYISMGNDPLPGVPKISTTLTQLPAPQMETTDKGIAYKTFTPDM